MYPNSAEARILASRSKNLLQLFRPEAANPINLSLSFAIVIVLHSIGSSASTFDMYFFVIQAFACHDLASSRSVEETACSSNQSRHLCSPAARIVRGAPSTRWSIRSLNCDGHQLLSITRLRLSVRMASRGRLHHFSRSLERRHHRTKRNLYRLFRSPARPKNFESQHDVPRASTVAPSPSMHRLLNHGETKNT